MIVRIRPTKEWTFEEKLAMISVGAAGSITMAIRATKLPGSQLGDLLESAIRKLPKTDLPGSLTQLAILWWRGISIGVWSDQEADGRVPSRTTATLWHDDYEQLRRKHRLARNEPVPQIDAQRTQVDLAPAREREDA